MCVWFRQWFLTQCDFADFCLLLSKDILTHCIFANFSARFQSLNEDLQTTKNLTRFHFPIFSRSIILNQFTPQIHKLFRSSFSSLLIKRSSYEFVTL